MAPFQHSNKPLPIARDQQAAAARSNVGTGYNCSRWKSMQSPIHIKRWQTSASVLCYSGLLFDVESLESYALDLIITDI